MPGSPDPPSDDRLRIRLPLCPASRAPSPDPAVAAALLGDLADRPPEAPHYERFEQLIEAELEYFVREAVPDNDSPSFVDAGYSLAAFELPEHEEILRSLAGGDCLQVARLLHRLGAANEAVARKRGRSTYDAFGLTQTEDGVLAVVLEQRPVTHFDRGSALRPGRLGPVLRRMCGARTRESRGKAVRTHGSRRITSRSAGGGSSGDDSSGGSSEPALGRQYPEFVIEAAVAVAHV